MWVWVGVAFPNFDPLGVIAGLKGRPENGGCRNTQFEGFGVWLAP